jgi:hypothetical protein
VRLVDDQQAGGRRQLRQHGVAEAGVVEPLGLTSSTSTSPRPTAS